VDTYRLKRILSKEIAKIRRLQPDDIKDEFRRIYRKLPNIIHLKQLVFFSIIFSIIISVLFWDRFSSLNNYHTYDKPFYGGTYTEGIVGEVKGLNPLFSALSPAEDDLSTLVFSGLLKTNSRGELEGDLAEIWSKSADGKDYYFNLRKNVKWHDGAPFKADDVIFTINSIQNPDARSPYFYNWKGVTVNKVDDHGLKISLEKSLNSFTTNLTVGILPKHLLEKVPPKNLRLAEFNLMPIGTDRKSVV